MPTRKMQGFPGNSSEAEVNLYRDLEKPWITYSGTRGGPSACRNVWYIQDEKSSQRLGPFLARRMAYNYAHRDNGTTDMAPQAFVTVAPSGPPPPPTDDPTPLITFTCPACHHPLVALVAAQ